MTTMASNSWSSGTGVSVAILYEHEKYRQPLVSAVSAAGAELAAQLRFSQLHPGAIDTLSANTLLVSLESLLDRKPKILDQVFAEQGARVLIMNDAAASEHLAGADLSRWQRHLAEKIVAAAQSPLLPLTSVAGTEQEVPAEEDFEVWILGASIGGPEALRSFLSELDAGCSAALVLAQHIGAEFVLTLSEQLQQVSALPVKMAEDGMQILPGQVIVVPVGKRISVNDSCAIELSDYQELPQYSPSIDDAIAGLLERFGSRLHGIIFSGMASDGVAGAAAIRESGGQLWVQSPQSCVVSSMVEGTLRDGPVQRSETPEQLAHHLNERLARKGSLAFL